MDSALRRAIGIQNAQLDSMPAIPEATPSLRAYPDTEFEKGVTRGVTGVSATTQAAVAQALEPFAPQAAARWFAGANETLRQSGSADAPKVATWDDVKVGENLSDYALGKVGEALPSTVMSLGAGALGRPFGRTGMYGAMGATVLPQEAGEAALSLQNDPAAMANTTAAQRLGLSLGKGAVNSALENVPEAVALNRVFGGGTRIARGFGPAAQRLVGSAAEGAVGEGLTEGAQELTGQYVQNLANPNAGYDASQVREAAIGGAFGGAPTGVLGGAGQVLHSNLTPSANEVQSVKRSVVQRLPSVDQTITFMRTAMQNPEQFGTDVRDMTLDAWDKAIEAGTWAKEAAQVGAKRMASAAKDFDDTLATAIANSEKIKDPANRQFVMELYEGTKAKTVDSYNTLKDIVAGEGLARAEGGAKVAAAARNTAVDTGNWIKKFYTGLTTKEDGRKESRVGLSANDKYNLETINVTPELEGARNWLSSQDTGTRNAFLKILSTIQNGSMTKEQKRELHKVMTEQGVDVGAILRETRARLGKQPDTAEWLEDLNTANTPQSQLSPAGSLGRNEVLSTANTEDEANPDFGLADDLGVDANAMQTRTESEDRIDPDLNHNIIQRFFQRQSKTNEKPYSMPVRFKGTYEDGTEVNPKDFFKLFKAREMAMDRSRPIGNGKYAWTDADRDFKPEEVRITPDGEAEFFLNPMSMIAEATNPKNKDNIRNFLPAKGKNENKAVRAGNVFNALMSSMLDKGFTATMPDGRQARVSVSLNPDFKLAANRRDPGTVLALGRDKDGSPITYEDFVNKSAKKPANVDGMSKVLETYQSLGERLKKVPADQAVAELKRQYYAGDYGAGQVVPAVYRAAAKRMAATEGKDSNIAKLLDMFTKLDKASTHKTVTGLNKFDTKAEAEEYLVDQLIKSVPDEVVTGDLPAHMAAQISGLRDSIADQKTYKIIDGVREMMRDNAEIADKLLDSAIAYYKDRDSETGAQYLDYRDELGLPKIKPSEVKSAGLIERLEDMKREREKADAVDMSVGHVKEHREDYSDKPSDEFIGAGEQEPNDASDVVAQDARRETKTPAPAADKVIQVEKGPGPKNESTRALKVPETRKSVIKVQKGTRDGVKKELVGPTRVKKFQQELKAETAVPKVEGAKFTDEEIEALSNRGEETKPAAKTRLVDLLNERMSEAKSPREKINVLFDELKKLMGDMEPSALGPWRFTYKDQDPKELAFELQALANYEWQLRDSMSPKQESAISEMGVKATRAFQATYNKHPTDFEDKPDGDGNRKNSVQQNAAPNLTITASTQSGYAARTARNAKKGDITIAFAADHTTAGERLTARLAGNKLVKYTGGSLTSFADSIVAKLKAVGGTSINVAGNGIYTWAKSGKTQDSINKAMFEIMKRVKEQYPALDSIVTGGQTGSDIAGAVAGHALGLNVDVHMPPGYLQRDASGRDFTQSKEAVERYITEQAAALNSGTDKADESDVVARVRKLLEDNYGRKYSEQKGDAQAAADAAIEATKEKIIAEVKKRFGGRVAVVFTNALKDGVSGTYRKLDKQDQIDPSKYKGESREKALERLREERRTALRTLRRAEKLSDPNEFAQYLMDSGYSTGTRDQVMEHVHVIEEELAQVEADEKVLGVISLAADFDNLATLADHESLHAAFDIFFTPDERRTLAQAFTSGIMKNKMREYFKDEPAVLKAIEENPEEAIAYGFQMYVADPNLLKAGPKTKTLFQKLKETLAAFFNIMTPEQRASIILNDLITGRRAQTGLSPVAPVLDKHLTTTQKVKKHAAAVTNWLVSLYDAALTGMHTRLHATNNPAIQKIADLAYKGVGGTGDNGMIQNWEIEAKSRINDYSRSIEKFSPEVLAAAHDALINEVNRNTIADPEVAKAVDVHDKFFKEMLKYQKDAGVDMGTIKQHYFPLQWDAELVTENAAEFLKMLKQPKYESYFEELMKTPEEVRDDIIAEIERRDSFDSVVGKDDTPIAQSTKQRSLGFIDAADRAPYVSKNLNNVMMAYTLQAVRKAEFTRSFGKDGKKLKALLKEAKETYGATPDQMELVRDYIDGILGNREPGMSREVKDVMGAITVYQNWRLLPLNLFASLVDPLGIAIRSNSMGDAWRTFSYGVKNLFRDLKQRGDIDKDQFEKLAEDWGIISRHGIEANVHHMYEAVELRGMNQRANELLFKYNLVNGWNKSNKIMAVAAAQRFMVRLKDGTYKGEQQQRYLDELGLTEDDIVLDDDGNLVVREADLAARGVSDAKALEEKLRKATTSFVNQAVLNPNAAEVAGWMSNPYFALVAHLKSFMFSFQKNILGRVANEAKEGNYAPALMATAYIPGTIAAEYVRTMISGLGEEPPWKENWTMSDHLLYGVERSGLMGTGAVLADINADIDHGGKGFESFAGPSIGQAQDATEVVVGKRDASNFVVDSAPLAPLFRQHLRD
jgi:hypothetical protein